MGDTAVAGWLELKFYSSTTCWLWGQVEETNVVLTGLAGCRWLRKGGAARGRAAAGCGFVLAEDPATAGARSLRSTGYASLYDQRPLATSTNLSAVRL